MVGVISTQGNFFSTPSYDKAWMQKYHCVFVHASFANCSDSDLQPNWYKGAAVTVHHTQLPLSNLNSCLYLWFLLRLLGLLLLSLMVALLLSSNVRSIVILWINLIKVVSSSYGHQLSPSSCHCRDRANISLASKDVSIRRWVWHLLLIADHKPSTELCVWCINIQHQHQSNTPWMPFFCRHEGLKTVKILPLVACPIVALLWGVGNDVGWSWPPLQCWYYDSNVEWGW